MRIDQFDYHLPDELIAQQPAEPRDASRLLALDRAGGVRHHAFREMPGLLPEGALLVFNDTRVVAARLSGIREQTHGKWEGLFVRANPDGTWELLTQMRGNAVPGETLLAVPPGGGGPLRLVIEARTPGGRRLVRAQAEGTPAEVLARYGQVPIPPYIREGHAEESDVARYQTLYARRDGAVAAPTAGLHFTEAVFTALAERNVERAFVTLHVGPGTFQPVKVDDVTQHRVEPEWGEVPEETARSIRECKLRGGKVVAVGTTTTRLLEQAARGGQVEAWSGLADLTVIPPYEFRAIDALVTNFHLPRSSLLLLVSAFAGLERVRAAYEEAVARRYRFYSYGDAMLIM
jgi:S-adenosylmethionine:tRNA ribosyltransferase-isomerase